jgi:thiol:disulfide interchange protein
MYFFRANWCGHCQRFKPTWDKFVDTCTSSEEHQNTEIVELDVDQPETKPLLEKYNVTGFPTIIMVNHNTQQKRVFQDERTEEALLKFMKQQ